MGRGRFTSASGAVPTGGTLTSRRPGAADIASPGGRVAERLIGVLRADPAASAAHDALAAEGQVVVVGGAVRDVLLGVTPKDVDLMVSGVPAERVAEILGALAGTLNLTGRAFRVFRYRTPEGAEVEVALPRTERSTGAGHRDFQVNADHRLSVDEDLARRDFTCNAIAFSPVSGRISDPFGGAADIAAGRLVCVSESSFADDPLRILRGVRAHAQHRLAPDASTHAMMRAHAGDVRHLSGERIGEEWLRMLSSRDPLAGLRLGWEIGMWPHLFPEMAAGEEHADRIRAMSMERVRRLGADADPELLSAAFLSAHPCDGDQLRGALTQAMRTLVMPSRFERAVGEFVAFSRRPIAQDPAGVRRSLALMPASLRERAPLMLRALGDDPGAARYEAVIGAGPALDIADLAIGGDELMRAGLRGRAIGDALRALRERVLDEPQLNTPQALHRALGDITG